MKNSIARRLEQIPVGYLIMGVDPHKRKHAAMAMTQDFLVQGKFKFTNSRASFEEALERTKAEMVRTGCWGLIFAIETASHYWHNFGEEKGWLGDRAPSQKGEYVE